LELAVQQPVSRNFGIRKPIPQVLGLDINDEEFSIMPHQRGNADEKSGLQQVGAEIGAKS